MNIHPHVPEPAQPIIEDYISLVNKQLPGRLNGFYLVGSAALGELNENSITTKVRAAQYALGCLPIRWHRLVREAINIRERKKELAYQFKVLRMIEAVNFLKYIIHVCNASYPLK